MVDSIAVLPPGWRALDDNGDPFTDGVLTFYDAGTENLRTVYSDSTLSTSLGTSVDCDSGGTPVTSGNSPTLIYTGSTAYKVVISSSTAGFSRPFDNILGALDTSSFLTEAAVADQSVVATSIDRAITTADKGKLINVNCSGGAITITFADAATLGDGFFVGIRHDGTANQVKITGDGTDTFGISGVNTTGFSLTGRGHTVWTACDATNFKVTSECPPLIGGTVGTIAIADRLSTPPVSPTPGGRYIVGSSPTGDWSSFAEHDIAEASGFGTWFNYTPAADCGWVAYVQDEDRFYSFKGSAWTDILNVIRTDDLPSSAGVLIAIIEDQKTQNTAPQALTSGADRVRELTTLVYNRDTIVSLSSNQFTLPAGTWEIEWWTQVGNGTALHQSLIYNVTDAADVARGTVGYADDGASVDAGTPVTVGSTVVTIAGSKAFELRHRVSANTNGGRLANLGTEIYSRVIIRRA